MTCIFAFTDSLFSQLRLEGTSDCCHRGSFFEPVYKNYVPNFHEFCEFSKFTKFMKNIHKKWVNSQNSWKFWTKENGEFPKFMKILHKKRGKFTKFMKQIHKEKGEIPKIHRIQKIHRIHRIHKIDKIRL